MKTILGIIRFLLTLKSKSAVRAGVVSYAGQGRDHYGN